MGFIRRMLAIALGLGAGVLAIKILQDYNKDRYIEGEFVELSGQEGEADHPHAAAQPQPAEPVHPAQKPDNGPNVNPVTLGTADRPLDANGRLDPTRIADPADFGDWDDLGCQG